jgi:hypothetical protein
MTVRWQDWLSVALGCWLVISPWQMDYWLDRTATGNACGIGVALIIFNLISVRRMVDSGQEIVNILIGFWLILSPFSLNFGQERSATLNALLLGSAVVILAIWQIRDAIK